MKLWTVYLIRKSGRGRVEYDTLEAETAEQAIEIATRNAPGYEAYGAPKQEETNEEPLDPMRGVDFPFADNH